MGTTALIPRDIQAPGARAGTGVANSGCHIEITIAGGTARLTGQVSSWAERRDIERAAGDAPGVVRVENRLEVLPAGF